MSVAPAVILALGAVFVASSASAELRCEAHRSYGGRTTHPPVMPPDAVAVGSEALDPALAARLDQALETARATTDITAITAAVAVPGSGRWSRDVTPDATPLLFWASAGKTMTATVVLQLVEEKKIALDDPVSRWVEGVPGGNVATIRDLLAHTSGLFSANEDTSFRKHLRYRSPAETLAIARQHGLRFCPGADWRYSNTGYDVLGMIVEQVDGRPVEEAISARILRPLGLLSMRALVPGKKSVDVSPPIAPATDRIEPSWAGAAGPVAGTAADMIRFWEALLGGRLLRRATVEEMFTTLYPMFDDGTFYGLGTMLFDVPDGERRLVWLGHAGGVPGAQALVAYAPDHRAFVAVALTGTGSAAAVANLLTKCVTQRKEDD